MDLMRKAQKNVGESKIVTYLDRRGVDVVSWYTIVFPCKHPSFRILLLRYVWIDALHSQRFKEVASAY